MENIVMKSCVGYMDYNDKLNKHVLSYIYVYNNANNDLYDILNKNYNSIDKVKELISLNDVYSISDKGVYHLDNIKETNENELYKYKIFLFDTVFSCIAHLENLEDVLNIYIYRNNQWVIYKNSKINYIKTKLITTVKTVNDLNNSEYLDIIQILWHEKHCPVTLYHYDDNVLNNKELLSVNYGFLFEGELYITDYTVKVNKERCRKINNQYYYINEYPTIKY